jgi:hypothetical protein
LFYEGPDEQQIGHIAGDVIYHDFQHPTSAISSSRAEPASVPMTGTRPILLADPGRLLQATTSNLGSTHTWTAPDFVAMKNVRTSESLYSVAIA